MLFLSLFFSSLKAKFDVIRKDRDYYTEATTLEVDFESSVKRVYFRFRGMQDKWNEWVEAESTRIAPHQAYTRAPHLLKKPAKKADKKADKKDGEKKRSATPTSIATNADSTDADSTSAPPPPRAIQTSVSIPQNNLQARLQLLAMREQERRQQQQLRARAEMAQQAQYAQWIAQQRAQQAGAGLQYNQQLQQLQQQLQQQQLQQQQQQLPASGHHSYQHQMLARSLTEDEEYRLRALQEERFATAARAAQQIGQGTPAHQAYSNVARAQQASVSHQTRPNPPGARPNPSLGSSEDVDRKR